MIIALLALAMLCGVPLGFIIGVAAAWQLGRSMPPNGDEPDYSGGL